MPAPTSFYDGQPVVIWCGPHEAGVPTRFGPQPPSDDTAAFNLELARGLPGGEDLDVPLCLRTLDEWAARVWRETERLFYLFQRDPSAFGGSEAQFRVMALVTVLQRDLGVHYRQELIDMSDDRFFGRADHLFIHGVVQGQSGSCSSLPAAYAAVGRRLGYPVRVVKTLGHLFARWDNPFTGERFNFDCAMRGFEARGDDHYRRWPYHMTPELERRYAALRSLTRRQEEALYVATRGHCLAQNERLAEAAHAFATAWDADPADEGHSVSLVDAMNRWDKQQQRHLCKGFPPIRIHYPPVRRYPSIPQRDYEDILFLQAREVVLRDPVLSERYWEPRRRFPFTTPREFPALVSVRFPAELTEDVEVLAFKDLPSDFNPVDSPPK